jgi:hypothetical protein
MMFAKSQRRISLKKWSILLAVCAAAFANVSCATSRSLLLVTQIAVPAPQRQISVSEIRVEAPKRSENVCNFADVFPRSGSDFEVTYDGTTFWIKQIEVLRGEFDYYLENDSQPLFEDALRKAGLVIASSSPRMAEAKAQFRYFLVSRGDFNNRLAIRMDLSVSIKQINKVDSQKTYSWSEAEKYSSAFVTYPRSDTFNSLFNKALAKIITQVSADLASIDGASQKK